MAVSCSWSDIVSLIEKSDSIFIKKLSRNDCSWADDPSKHQSGIYIPAEIQEARFFPRLANSNPAKPHILDTFFETTWPATGEVCQSRLKHYTNKGREFHFTHLPKEHFTGLSPASLLVCGKSGAQYWLFVVDSLSEEAELLETAFSLPSDFHFGLFSPEQIGYLIDEEELFIKELADALHKGTLDACIERYRMPRPDQLAANAQSRWLESSRQKSLDPYVIEAPGDAVMRISRDIEYALYQQAELRHRAAQAAALLLRGNDPLRALVKGFRQLDGLFLSAAQTRKSRAGLSFEQHVQRLLADGRIRHQPQAVFGGRRPDFVLPDAHALNDADTREVLILSLKTTLRERWKQVGLERRHAEVFLATVDDRVSAQAIADMATAGIVLVVPEALKTAKEACYEKAAEVISFRSFFDAHVATRPALLLPGPPPPKSRPA